MIVAKEPAEPRSAPDGTGRTRWREPVRRNQPIVQALVIPFPVSRSCDASSAAPGALPRARQGGALLLSWGSNGACHAFSDAGQVLAGLGITWFDLKRTLVL